jgi:hypothetical protein
MNDRAMRFKAEAFDHKLHTRLSALGDREIVQVTLPRLVFMAGRDDPKAVAEQISTIRTIRAGRDAWQAIGKAESFEAWRSIGAALAIGKAHALRVTGANRAAGQHYCREFGKWVREYGFDRMPKSTRSVAILLHENATAIEEWRATLPERQRRRLIHPLSNCLQDLKREAMRAWRRFVSLARLLPPDQAAPLWQCVVTEASVANVRNPPKADARGLITVRRTYANLLEQAINCDDGDRAAKIIQHALGIENDDLVKYCFPKTWPEDREERAHIIGYWLESEARFLA